MFSVKAHAEQKRLIKVLLVEDEVDDAHIIRLGLPRQAGFHVTHARNADEALEATRKGRFEVALVDHRLPGCTGVDLCRRLRENGFEGRIIVLSSVRQDRVVDLALRAGADDFMIKSHDMGERLQHDVRQILG